MNNPLANLPVYVHPNAPKLPTVEQVEEFGQLSKKLGQMEFSNPFELMEFMATSKDARRHRELSKVVMAFRIFNFEIVRQTALN